jgi:mono/diheme cytochrome c family protein
MIYSTFIFFKRLIKGSLLVFLLVNILMCTNTKKESDTSKSPVVQETSKPISNKLDLATATVLTDEASLKAGAETYKKLCSACHGASGEGLVGPNFTDNSWIHGGEFKDLCKVIVNGVPEKGMIAWAGQLSGEQISQVASYILSMEGNKVSNPKAAQGTIFERKEKIAFATNTSKVAEVNIPKIAMKGNIEKGKVLFNGSLGCGHCHGPDGVGHVDNRNLKGLKYRYKSDAKKVFDTAIHLGRAGTAMPPWGHISMTQKEDLKAYIFSIQN